MPTVLSRSLRRKLLATALAAVGFVLMYEATVIDSRNGGRPDPAKGALPLKAGARLDFVATAYCRGQTTASGVSVTAGIAAGDPGLLPEGSVVQVEGVMEAYRGIYTILDTGPMVRGRHVDLYMWNCDEAVTFGRRDVVLTVLRLGWNPRNSAPGMK